MGKVTISLNRTKEPKISCEEEQKSWVFILLWYVIPSISVLYLSGGLSFFFSWVGRFLVWLVHITEGKRRDELRGQMLQAIKKIMDGNRGVPYTADQLKPLVTAHRLPGGQRLP